MACAWGRLESVKHIVTGGADIEFTTIHGEKPIDVAKRYKHTDIVEYLEWIAVRNSFLKTINDAKEFASDPTKNLNKLNKDDKKKIEKYTVDLLKWSDENNNMNQQQAFITKTKEAEEFLAPFYTAVNQSIENETKPQTPKTTKK
ncbi:unnamed protein product [Didymodactylos carnosus]|nr:unnamed protein product [Didymodactylos carnosus]CAF4137078.1 unnamed protein product [Didymodactylos carnosus]